MDLEDKAPVRRKRMSAHGMIFRRRRVLARLRQGLTYDEIAAEEGVSRERIRQIVSEILQKRGVDSRADHAKLQLDRLAPAVQLGAEAIATGDVSAIAPYLKALDRLDRYQSVAVANQAYDDDARKRLMEKINRLVENLEPRDGAPNGEDDPSKETVAFSADEPGEAGGAEALEDPGAAQPEEANEAAQWMSI
jgi:DNA-binding CsgD family transcriptional regulator